MKIESELFALYVPIFLLLKNSTSVNVQDNLAVNSSAIIYDELPDLDTIFISEEDFLREYLAPSLDKLATLQNTLESTLVKQSIDKSQYFITHQNNKIYLDTLACQNSHDIITDITDPALILCRLTKRPDTHSGLFVEASKTWHALESVIPFIKHVPEEIFCKIIVKNYSINFIHKVTSSFNKNQDKESFSTQKSNLTLEILI